MKPYAELHVHLEGSVTPDTACELNPSVTLAEARERYRHSDFRGFIESYIWVNRLIETPEHYAHITRRLLESLERQNVVYAEVNLSVGVVLWKEQDFPAIFDAITAAAEASPVQVRWIFDAVRQFGADAALRVAELAAERAGRGVAGFGIGGDEVRGPVEWFGDVFSWARSRGLHIVPHAGETVGPESVWKALELGAERIGHGIRAADDPVLLRYLADHKIPLEVSITSNLRTGAVRSLDEHPIRRLYEAGVPLTLNTDDPGIFETTLQDEYALARDAFGFTEPELESIRENAFRYAFTPAGTSKERGTDAREACSLPDRL